MGRQLTIRTLAGRRNDDEDAKDDEKLYTFATHVPTKDFKVRPLPLPPPRPATNSSRHTGTPDHRRRHRGGLKPPFVSSPLAHSTSASSLSLSFTSFPTLPTSIDFSHALWYDYGLGAGGGGAGRRWNG